MTSTAGLHREAENRVEELQVFASEQTYVQWLSATIELHEFFSDTTNAAATLLGLTPVAQSLIDALREDLSVLIGAQATEPSTRLSATHATGRLDEMLGVLYVFEGSGLGARVLCQRAIDAEVRTTRFLERSRHLATDRWPKVVAALNGHPSSSPTFVDRCAAAANDVFAFFIAALNAQERHPTLRYASHQGTS